jgi:hypothetical protein
MDIRHAATLNVHISKMYVLQRQKACQSGVHAKVIDAEPMAEKETALAGQAFQREVLL